jgi:V-type H+-transporting ATPase proteolipid subunit
MKIFIHGKLSCSKPDVSVDCHFVNKMASASANFFGYMGCASGLIFANLGAAYGTAKSGVGLCSMGCIKPELVMKNIIPIVMAGV